MLWVDPVTQSLRKRERNKTDQVPLILPPGPRPPLALNPPLPRPAQEGASRKREARAGLFWPLPRPNEPRHSAGLPACVGPPPRNPRRQIERSRAVPVGTRGTRLRLAANNTYRQAKHDCPRERQGPDATRQSFDKIGKSPSPVGGTDLQTRDLGRWMRFFFFFLYSTRTLSFFHALGLNW